MNQPSPLAAREKSPWLALGASFVILAVTIALTLWRPAESRASENEGQTLFVFLEGDYHSPHACRECHKAEFEAWSSAAHAEASVNPIFQTSLQREEGTEECLSCHTTGYDQATGRFALPGVTCEACHGPCREGHPDERMPIAATEDLCGTCHAGTLAEWRSGRHGKSNVACDNCHEVHSQKSHSSDQASDPCIDCHRDAPSDSTHTIHIEAAVRCIDCHVARSSDDASGRAKGNAFTGHTFTVLVSTCDDCHSIPLRTQ